MEIKTRQVSQRKKEVAEPQEVAMSAKEDIPSSLNYYEITDFPSKKLPYKDLFLEIRPYTWAEQKALASMSSARDMIKVVGNGVRSNIPIQDLTDGDFLWVALLRKLYSFPGAKFSGTGTCRNCKEKITKSLSFTDIEFEEIQVDALPVKIKGADKDIEMYPITVGNLLRLMDENNGKIDEVSYVASCISGVPFSVALDIVNNADAELGSIFESVVSKFRHNFKPIRFVCPSCGKVTEISLDPHGREVVLAPFHGEENISRYTVSFG